MRDPSPTLAPCKIIVLGAGNVGRAIVEALHEEHDVTVIDADAAAARRRCPTASTSAPSRATATTQAGPEQGRRRRRRPVHRLQPAGGGEPGLRDGRQAAVAARSTIIRTTSGAYLEAWRERQIDVDFMVSPELETANAISAVARHPGRPPHGRVRRRQGADRRVRRAGRRRRRTRWSGASCGGRPSPPTRAWPAIIRGERHRRAARRRADPARRPRGGDRVARGRARVEPASWHAQRRAHRRRRHLRRGADGHDDRPRPARARHCACAWSTRQRERAREAARGAARRCAASTPRRSTRSSSSASGSAAPPPRSSASTTTPRTSTAPCSPRATACA